jgi:hypothetical protein
MLIYFANSCIFIGTAVITNQEDEMKTNKEKAEKLESLGGSRWQKNGNDRVYFNAKMLSSISGISEENIQYQISLRGGDSYYDVISGTVKNLPATDDFKNIILPALKNIFSN